MERKFKDLELMWNGQKVVESMNQEEEVEVVEVEEIEENRERM